MLCLLARFCGLDIPWQLGRLGLVPDADDAHVRHLGVVEQDALELGGRHLEALVFDELLDAVDDPVCQLLS